METKEKRPESPSQKKYSKGFYAVLAVCLFVVGAAAWSTYGTVADYTKDDGVIVKQSTSNEEQAGVPISGVTQETEPTEAAEQENREATTTQVSTQQITTQSKQTLTIEGMEIEKKEYIYPVGNNILYNFSPETPVYNKTLNDWRTHMGTDFLAESGTTVKAIDSGVIKDIYNDEVLGMCISAEHSGGFEALYAGVQPNETLEKGQKITAGDVIGILSRVPFEAADESHLHLQIFADGKAVDPMKLLKAE